MAKKSRKFPFRDMIICTIPNFVRIFELAPVTLLSMYISISKHQYKLILDVFILFINLCPMRELSLI